MSHARGDRERVQLVHDERERAVDVIVDGAPFTSYIYPNTLKKPVLYPLRSARGTVVTRGYPMNPRPGERTDHPHHVGLWFNYGNVNGLDFWNHSSAIDPATRGEYGTIRHRAVKDIADGEEGVLEVAMEWLTPDEAAILREDTTFVFCGTSTTRTVDRLATLTALDVDVSFTDDKEGMLGLRLANELEAPDKKPAPRVGPNGEPQDKPSVFVEGVNGLYRSSEGLEGDPVWGTRGDWVKLSGKMGDETVSIVMIDHPQNPGYPTYWHARGYGLFAANTLGQAAFSDGKDKLDLKLAAGECATFRYRVMIDSRDELSDETINAEFSQFAGCGT